MPQIRLDDNGEPIKSIILDDNGEPINDSPGQTVNNVKMDTPKVSTAPKGMFDSFMDAHPTIRQIGQRFLTGSSPEDDAMIAAEGIKKYPNNPEAQKYYGKPLGSPLQETSLLPELSEPSTYAGGFMNSLYEDFIRPIATPSGFIGASGPKKLPAPAPIPKKAPLLLGPGRDAPYIGGPTGATGQVTKSGNLKNIAAVEGKTVEGHVVGASPNAMDTEALREQERLKQIYYTKHEHQGGSSLEIKDGELMDVPAQSEDRRLGFGTQSNANLEYPLNVVPNSLRPRTAQTVQRALHGDIPEGSIVSKEKITFESPKAPPAAKVIPKKDPTRAIEPGEKILPSAPVTLRKNLDGTNSPVDNPSIKLDNDGGLITGPISKLLAALKEARPLNKQQAAIYTAEKSKRVGMANTVETPGMAGFFERQGMLSGKHSKVQMEAIKLDKNDVDELVNTIEGHPDLMRYGKQNAVTGLNKVLNGQVPQKNEIDLLERVFGKGNIDEMRAILPEVGGKAKSHLMDGMGFFKAIQSTYDLSAPFRQGLGSITTKAWWDSWGAMVKSGLDKEAYDGLMTSIRERPNFARALDDKGKALPSYADTVGLDITDLHTNQEEAIASRLAERIPGVKGSNRAYNAFLNKVRADNFDRVMNDATRIYESAKKIATNSTELEAAEMLNPRVNLKLGKDLAGMVNNATGRGNLGGLERYAGELNMAFFSPRFIASRLAYMNPMNFVSKGPQVRKEYVRSIMGIAGAWGTMAALGKMAGGEVSFDSTSSDFMKVKFGNTRFDPSGGFQTYLVLASRMANGMSTSSVSGNENEYGAGYGAKSRGDAIIEFVRNKLAPVPGFSTAPAFATENRPFDVVDKSVRMFAPMFVQTLSELIQEDPEMIPGALPFSFIGGGVQSYDGETDSKLLGPMQPEMKFEGGQLW